MDDGTGVSVTTSDGTSLVVRCDGSGDGPPLVLLNSLGTDLTMWDRQVPRWATRRRIIRFDHRGHGRSGAPAGPYTIERLGHDVLEVAAAVAGDAPVDVCGLSLGGVVALWVAGNEPDRLRRMVVADTAARVATRETWHDRAALVAERGMSGVADAVLERFFSAGFRQGEPTTIEEMRRVLLATPSEGYRSSCLALADTDLHDLLPRIVAPTLVVAGGDDVSTPVVEAQRIAARISGARLQVLPGAGHLVNLERPDAFAQLVDEHLVS